jgi:hypothetical protein
VTGTGFNPNNVYANLLWNTASTEAAPIGRSNVGSDGSLVFNVQVPPTGTAGPAFFYVRTVIRTGTPQTAQVDFTVTKSQHKAALIVGPDTKTDTAIKNLLDLNGIPTVLISLSSIKDSTSFSSYDLVMIANDTSTGNSWGTSNARSALAKFGRPILGIGEGGYYYLGTLGLAIGGNGAYGSSSLINPIAPTAPIFKTPYLVPEGPNGITLFNSASSDVEIYLPKPGSSTFQFGQVPGDSAYYSLIQQGRFFLWGFDGSPSTMTSDGQHLFVNLA